MTMAVAIDNSCLALDFIPQMQSRLDRATGGGRRVQIHRVSAHATIQTFGPSFSDSEFWKPNSAGCFVIADDDCSPNPEALEWQPDPDDDLDDAAAMLHLHQVAATVPALSSVISRSDQCSDATTLSGSALSASIKARTQGRPLYSFHRLSFRCSFLFFPLRGYGMSRINRRPALETFLPCLDKEDMISSMLHFSKYVDPYIVWASSQREDYAVILQLQLEVIDLLSRRTHPTSLPRKRRRTTFDTFLQVSHSRVAEDRSRRNPPPHARRFNGVRHRSDRKIWVAEMRPPNHNHKNKQDFGNFKSDVQAAHAVDAAFYHYGRPDLLNFPDTSLQFLATRPTAPPVLDEKAKVKFVKEEAKFLLAAIAVTSTLHSTPTNSLQILESPKRSPSCQFRSLSDISWPFSSSGPDEGGDAVSQPQPWMHLDSIVGIATTGVQTNLETLNSVHISEQGWDWAEDSSTLAAPPNAVNSSACEIRSMWLDSLIRSPPPAMYSTASSPSRLQEEIVYALLEQQSL